MSDKGLSFNHTILGIHTAGNEGSTDALGFFNPDDHDGAVDED